MHGIAPFTCIFWIDDPILKDSKARADRLHQGSIPVSRTFSSATEGLDWILATARNRPDFTGEIEIFDSYGSCLYSDILTSYNPHESDHVAS